MLDWMGRAALEIIGQAGLGHSFDRLNSHTESDTYTKAAKTYLCVRSPTTINSWWLTVHIPRAARSPLPPSWSRCGRRARS